MLGFLLDINDFHMGILAPDIVVPVIAIRLKRVFERLHVTPQLSLIFLAHVLEHLVDGILDGIKLLVDLCKRSRHEEHRRVIGHRGNGLDRTRIYLVEPSLSEASSCISKGSEHP